MDKEIRDNILGLSVYCLQKKRGCKRTLLLKELEVSDLGILFLTWMFRFLESFCFVFNVVYEWCALSRHQHSGRAILKLMNKAWE